MRDLALTTGPARSYGPRMTSYQIIEQLVAERQADLARSWSRQPILAEIVADRALPDVVRERALGRLLMWRPRRSDAHQEALDDAA